MKVGILLTASMSCNLDSSVVAELPRAQRGTKGRKFGSHKGGLSSLPMMQCAVIYCRIGL